MRTLLLTLFLHTTTSIPMEKKEINFIGCKPYIHSITEPELSPEKKQKAQDEYELITTYGSSNNPVTFIGYQWTSITEERRTGRVVVLEPQKDNPHHGILIKTVLEIHKDPNDKLYQLKKYQATEPAAFLIGSAIIAGVAYLYFKPRTSCPE